MDWIEELMALAASDPWYQECLADVNAREPAFLTIRDTLTVTQQEQLDGYIAACEELEHSLVLLAHRIP